MEKIKLLEYTPDFKETIANNPGALKSFLKLEKEIIAKEKAGNLDIEGEEVFQDGVVTVTPLYEYIEMSNSFLKQKEYEPKGMGSYLKAELGDEKYFVKTVPAYFDKVMGVEEFQTLKRARDVLKDFPDVEVLDFQLGYQDKDKTYFVAKWIDFPKVDEVGDLHPGLFDRAKEIENLLEENGFVDGHSGNMFYDEKTGKIYIYDISEKGIEISGSSR